MAEYREDFRYNREWWIERMGVGNNNEYLWIQFKNGDNITVQADYFQMDGNTCLPRFRAEEVAYISRYYGDQVETTTAADIVVDTDRIILYADGVEYFRYEMNEEEFKEMRRQMSELDFDVDSTAWMLEYCRTLATSRMNTPDPTPTETEKEENELIHTSRWGDTDKFTVVDEFPVGAIVWNIGRHNFPFPGFIPVAWPLDDCHIDRARLMAVKCKDNETADAILKEAGRRGVIAKRFAELNA